MPPKIKTNRAALIAAAFEIAKNRGTAAITAQSVAQDLGTSVAPIFREFRTMEELKMAVVEEVKAFHIRYIQEYPLQDSAFLTYGLAYIEFAKTFPHLFEIILIPDQTDGNKQIPKRLAFIVESVAKEGGIKVEQAEKLFFQVWIYTHGIACLIYKGTLFFTKEEERQQLIDVFHSFLQGLQKQEVSMKKALGETEES